jgi:hypothetical protein
MSKIKKAKTEALTSSDFETPPSPTPRILLFDIETAPHQAFVWGHWEQNVLSYIDKGYMLSFAYKWLDERKTECKALPHYEDYEGGRSTEKDLLWDLWKLFDEADIVVAHNGKSFDVKVANQRFLVNGLPVPSFFRVVDTKLVARKFARFSSNKLDHLGEDLEVGRKLKHQGFEMWLGCMSGKTPEDMKHWRTMIRYNKQDVKLLEQVYLKLRPWMEDHPNLNVLLGRDTGCSHCGLPASAMVKRGFRWTNMSRAQRYQCRCGGYTQGKYQKVSTQRSG